MVTNDLGACEWFVWDLRRSGLIDRGQLDQIVSEFLKRNPRAEAPALAEYLVHQGTLTGFQAERILNGKTQGLVLGPYVLLDAIGQGSMGQVYKANSKNDQNFYAVKVLPRRSMWNVRLARRQVRSFGQFSHPAIVPFVDVGTAGGLHYLVWPLVEGESLETVIQQHGKLSVSQTAMIGVQVAQGLAVAHQNNLFHGLIKPSNLLLGSDNQVRILDSGIGSLLVENEGESLVDTMSTANTLTSGLDCASPESILEPTNRTPAGDQYSLGCVLYNCLTGQMPFPEGSAVEKMMAHQNKEPTPIKDYAPEVPDVVVEVVHRLMAKKPEDRYTGLDEVVEALEPYLGDLMQGQQTADQQSRSQSTARYSATATAGSRSGVRASSQISGSSGRMAGLPDVPAQASPSRMASMAPPATRARAMPSGPQTPPPAPGGMPNFPGRSSYPQKSNSNPGMKSSQMGAMSSSSTANPVPVRTSGPMFPSRAAVQQAYDPDDVPLTPVAPESPPYADAARQSIPGGWMPQDEDSRKPAFGTLGIVAATIILMVLVFLGATLLLNRQ